MKYLVVSCILFLCTLQTFGQQEYFIYLQTDNNQPFYIRFNNNVYSSSSTGYCILSKLPDSARTLTIGFPQNVFPEQLFNIPVNHKDAGYLLKNFGDKGWGLFNLQSLSVVMNSNPPNEKKNPELTGTRKTDAFSVLLANAVNDTAVLYTAIRPPKPAPVAAVREETKKDSVLLAKTIPQKDSNAPAIAAQKDSLIALNNAAAAKDSTRLANAQTPPGRQPVAPLKKGQPGQDSVELVKKNSRPLTRAAAKNKAGKKETSSTARKNAPAQRKDTIIMMSGGPADKTVARKNRASKEKMPAPDTVRVKKEIIFAPEEKRNALLSNHDAVVIEKVPLRKDTENHPETRKDTIEMLPAKEPAPESKPDTIAAAPVKRLRPWVNKAAELLTDTSYIAVFVDESKEKFDTIRISIPFNEQSMLVLRPEPASTPKTLPADTPVTTPNPATPVISQAPVQSKKDSVAADSSTRENNPPQNIPAPVKNDTGLVDKKIADSSKAGDSLPATPGKDSAAPSPDTAQLTKAPVQPLFLNTDCKEIAFDSDIDKLRVKMLLVLSDEDRIALAKKLFKQKCFLVKQVRALSELFKTDEGKYKWFDAAYPFVSDTGNFASLGELIKDEYYGNRFKAMLRH